MTNAFTLLGEAALDLHLHGQKAWLLARCVERGERVPAGFVIDAPRALELAADTAAAIPLLARALERLRALSPPNAVSVAVRSSSAGSLPGALLSRLDVPWNAEAVFGALCDVLASAESQAARDQLTARGLTAPSAPWVAVIVQAFVPVHDAADLGAVAFTRDPSSGAPGVLGDHAPGQGAQSVVSGRAQPLPLASSQGRAGALEQTDPSAFARIAQLAARLELAFDEPLELELVLAKGELWLLQARPLVQSPRALVRATLDALAVDSPSYKRYLGQLADASLTGLVETRLPAPSEIDARRVLLRGIAASPGAASGIVAIDVAVALELSRREAVVLVRREAVPEDVAAFRAAKAVVTTTGGLTSHAAVIARGLRVPAVIGCHGVRVDLKARVVHAESDPNQVILREGDRVSVDAHRGIVYSGDIAPEPSVTSPELRQLFAEARKLRRAPLWVVDRAELALRLKEEVCLDGAVCSVDRLADLPPARGRECWVELDASQAVAAIDSLPSGWGIVVRGDLAHAPFDELRRRARLRPLGARLVGSPTVWPAGLRLDLVLLDAPVGDMTALSAIAPRVVARVDFSVDSSLRGNEPSGGVAASGSIVMECALRMAAAARATPMS